MRLRFFFGGSVELKLIMSQGTLGCDASDNSWASAMDVGMSIRKTVLEAF